MVMEKKGREKDTETVDSKRRVLLFLSHVFASVIIILICYICFLQVVDVYSALFDGIKSSADLELVGGWQALGCVFGGLLVSPWAFLIVLIVFCSAVIAIFTFLMSLLSFAFWKKRSLRGVLEVVIFTLQIVCEGFLILSLVKLGYKPYMFFVMIISLVVTIIDFISFIKLHKREENVD